MPSLQKQHESQPADAHAPDSSYAGSPPLLRPHVIMALFRRNVGNYFINPAGYVFITLFVLISALIVFVQGEFYANNLANLDLLNDRMPLLLLFFVPAITMSIWAEERKQGTEELLLTLPARDYEIVLGKYFAALGIYTVALAFASSLVGILLLKGRPDLGVMFANFLGYWFMGAMYIAIGMVASVLSANVTVAFILGAVFCAVPVFVGLVGMVFSDLGARQAIENLSVANQFRDFGAGAISISGAFYFLSMATIMLFLNAFLLHRRHWSGSENAPTFWGHGITQTFALVVALISATLVIETWGFRIDATNERLHSLSNESAKIVKEIPADKEVLIQAFYSSRVPREFIPTKNNFINLLKQFSAWGGKRIRLNLVETEPYTDEAATAAKLGINARPVISSEEARRTSDEIYLGVALTCGTEEIVLPFLDPGLPIEYELARSIKTITGSKRKKVGVLSTDVPIMGAGGMMGGGSPEWEFVSELKRQYDVKSVSADAPIDLKEVDVLIAPMASSLTQPQMDNLAAFIKAGGPTLLIEDPLPITNLMLSPVLKKPSPNRGNNMFGGGTPPAPPKGSMETIMKDLGIDWTGSDIVWASDNPHPQISELPPEFVFITTNTNKGRSASDSGRSGFNAKEAITAGMQEVVTLFGGRITRRGKPGLEFVPLLTTNQSGGIVQWREAVMSRFSMGAEMDVMEAVELAAQFGMPGALTINPSRPHRKTGANHNLAVEVRPEDKDAKGQPHVIMIADLDMISDEFFNLRRQSADSLRARGVAGLVFDNVNFVLNCVDTLANDPTFLEMRKRRPAHRTLEALEFQNREFEEKAQEAIANAESAQKEQLTKAQTELNKEVDAVKNNAALDERAKVVQVKYLEEVANRRFATKKEEIENATKREVEQIKTERERKVRQSQLGTKGLAFVAPILPAMLAIFVFINRASRENRGANPNRLA